MTVISFDNESLDQLVANLFTLLDIWWLKIKHGPKKSRVKCNLNNVLAVNFATMIINLSIMNSFLGIEVACHIEEEDDTSAHLFTPSEAKCGHVLFAER